MMHVTRLPVRKRSTLAQKSDARYTRLRFQMIFPTNRDRAKRYRVSTEFQSHTGEATGWRGADLAFGDDVAIYRLPAELSTDGEAIAAVAHAIELAHPGVVRWHSSDLAGGLAVREWVNGFTLLEFLRQRRKLATTEAIALLSRLPATLDWLSTRVVTLPDNLLSSTWVAFQPAISTAGLTAVPVSAWPAWQLKLCLVCPRDFWREIDDGTSQMTQNVDAPSGAHWMDLARLLRELLGDRVRSGPWTPLPTLNERANDLLRETLAGKTWKSAREFWAAFVMAAEESGSHNGRAEESVETFTFSLPSASQPAPCRMVALDPQDKACPPIHLCAGTEFRFGRDESVVDFPTILAPEALKKFGATGGISRRHARLQVRNGAIWLSDGDGETASSNGTQWNDVPLPAGSPVRMFARGVLCLANRYRLTLTPVFGGFAPAVVLGDKTIHSPEATSLGAVIPLPIGDEQPLWRAVWIRTALGFHLDAAGDIEWNLGDSIPPAGIFIRAANGFWLANADLPAHAIRVGDLEVSRGEAAPLLPGQCLRIGEWDYNVSMSD